MSLFNVSPLNSATIADVRRLRSKIDLSPPYQRQGEIWATARQQLFIDSLLNGFDIPKLYFHLVPYDDKKARAHKYAVVDGKQRLQAIWGFLDDAFTLSDDFEYFRRPELVASGLRFSQLPALLQSEFEQYVLPVQVIETDDLEWVEELFSRLNEAVALNAPERRNAMGGPLPALIRELPMKHNFFKSCLPFRNNRYRHYDLATKFLFLEAAGKPEETKKRTLDHFVQDYRDRNDSTGAKKLADSARAVLTRLEKVFSNDDYLLNSIGMVVVYYLLERDRVLSSAADAHDTLLRFDELRRQLRSIMRARESDDAPQVSLDSELVEFERLSQSPNDVGAMVHRMALIKAFVENPRQVSIRMKKLSSA